MDCGRKRYTWDTLLYHNYSRITDEKKTTRRKRQEDNIEGKQENEPNVKRILGIYHKGKLQKEIIKEDGLIGMVNWNG